MYYESLAGDTARGRHGPVIFEDAARSVLSQADHDVEGLDVRIATDLPVRWQ